MRSKKLLDAYRAISYWRRGFQGAIWNRGREVLFSLEQRQAIHDAERLAIQAQVKLDEVFGPEIGKAMISEIRK